MRFKGVGVEDTLKGVTKLLFKALSDFYGTESAPKLRSRRRAGPRPRPTGGAHSAPAPPPATARPQPSPASAPAPAAAKPPAAPAPAAKPAAPAPTPAAKTLAAPTAAPAPAARAAAPAPAPTPAAKPTPRRLLLPRRRNPPPAIPFRSGCQTRDRTRGLGAGSGEADRPAPAPTAARCRRHPPHAPPRRFASASSSGARPRPPPTPYARPPEVAPRSHPRGSRGGGAEGPPTTGRPPGGRRPAPNGEGLQPDQWIYLFDNAQRGPLDLDDLIDLVLTSLREDTKVWRPGLRGWTPANLVPEIAEQIPPPLPFTGAGEEDFPDFDTVPQALRTALIADEDEGFRKLLALPLAAQGFRIFEAEDGTEALESSPPSIGPGSCSPTSPWPRSTGSSSAAGCARTACSATRPLVFISSSDKFKDRARAQQVGANDFLSKQTPIRELLIRIQLLLDRYSDLSAKAMSDTSPGQSPPARGPDRSLRRPRRPADLPSEPPDRDLHGASEGPRLSAERVAVMGFREGEIINATVQDLTGTEAVYSFLGWQQGHFKFVPGAPGGGEPLAQSVEHLLLEGCRILDEANRGPEDQLTPA